MELINLQTKKDQTSAELRTSLLETLNALKEKIEDGTVVGFSAMGMGEDDSVYVWCYHPQNSAIAVLGALEAQKAAYIRREM